MRLSGSKGYTPGPGACFQPCCHFPCNGPTRYEIYPGITAPGGTPGRIVGRLSGKAGNRFHSFVPNTEVALADGKRKRIEDVETGDRGIAIDPETGKTTTRPVVTTIITADDKHCTDLTIKSPSGDSSIIATDTHPFWSADKKKWINAGDLRPGTQLRTPQGATAKITAVRHFRKQQRTHDLTIGGTHGRGRGPGHV
ncbi:polymorphic toxin-type HINT domain-containing protein [Streptomyces sp. C10]|uniref:polymorphic toxin-type HINT domain-containing protein n=1 Tax=Streptomyces sp. C10 TaxID=531941 RepID=UPI003980FD5F